MALNARQRALYNETGDVWRINRATGSATGKPVAPGSAYTKIASAITFGLFTKTEMGVPSAVGRFPGDQLVTSDVMKFDAAQEIDDGYVVKLTTTGSPLINTFWVVLGEPQIRPSRGNRRANFAGVYVKKLKEAPSGVS